MDARAGDIARGFQKIFGDVLTLRAFLDAKTDADLNGLGYSADEIYVLRVAFNDLTTLTGIWTGAQALPTAQDFRLYVRQLWGVGSF